MNGRWYIFHLSNIEFYENNIYLTGSSQLVNTVSNGITDGYVAEDSEVVISGKAFIFLDYLNNDSYFPNSPVNLPLVRKQKLLFQRLGYL